MIRLDGTNADLFNDDAATGKKCKMNCYGGFTDAVGRENPWMGSICSPSRHGKWTAILQATIEKMDWCGNDGDSLIEFW
jgi:hypothetical protein